MQVTRRRLLGEWLTLLCVLSALAVWIASGGGGTSVGGRLEGTDQFAYDTLQQFAPIAPSSDLARIFHPVARCSIFEQLGSPTISSRVHNGPRGRFFSAADIPPPYPHCLSTCRGQH